MRDPEFEVSSVRAARFKEIMTPVGKSPITEKILKIKKFYRSRSFVFMNLRPENCWILTFGNFRR